MTKTELRNRVTELEKRAEFHEQSFKEVIKILKQHQDLHEIQNKLNVLRGPPHSDHCLCDDHPIEEMDERIKKSGELKP